MKKATGLLAAMTIVLAACGGANDDAGGIGETIGVEGNWTIDVRDADGSLDQHLEFQNAFVGVGLLADVLSFNVTHTGWEIGASPGSGDPICATGSGQCSFTATAERDAATDELVLSGQFTAEFTSVVSAVFARLFTTESGNQVFSQKLFDTADVVPVAAGQIVQVEVRYTFG